MHRIKCSLMTLVAVAACAGRTPAPSPVAPAAVATPAPNPPPAAAGAATTHEVRMIGDAGGYRYEPATLTIRQGDSVAFVMVSGGPHQVSFESAQISAAARSVLAANMPEKVAGLSGKYLVRAGERYAISFAGLPPGEYPYFCTPHLAMSQHGAITVIAR